MSQQATRRKWLAGGVLLAVGSLASPWVVSAIDPPSGSSTPTPGVTIADLEQQLKSGLKARRPVEFDFIHQVVVRVKNGNLPIDLVQSTYLWARRHKPYPYPYFERGLRERAAKAGYALN